MFVWLFFWGEVNCYCKIGMKRIQDFFVDDPIFNTVWPMLFLLKGSCLHSEGSLLPSRLLLETSCWVVVVVNLQNQSGS